MNGTMPSLLLRRILKSLILPQFTLDNHKTVILERVPTAENMALTALELLSSAFNAEFGDSYKADKSEAL